MPAPAAQAPVSQAPVSATRPRVAVSSSPFTVRIAAYPPDSRWAASTLQDLRNNGEPAFFSPVAVRDHVYQRLLVGRFVTWELAYAEARRLRTAGLVEEFSILHLPFSITDIDASAEEWADFTAGAQEGWVGAFETVAEARLLVPDAIAEESLSGADN